MVRLFAFPNIITMESITLYFREGSSDKVYSASIDPKDGGHVVNFAYGRRGSTLNTGTKTPAPVDYQAANTVFDRELNAFFCHVAGDSKDDGVMWVYRYKKRE
jgi:hypothetical protein